MDGYYSTSVGESDIFEAIKGEVLIYLRDFLVDKLATDKIITYLRSKRILDQSDEEDIRAERTTIQKNSKLLDLVDSRGSEGFDQFCHAIRERCTGQGFILEKILLEFEKRKRELSKKTLYRRNYSSVCSGCRSFTNKQGVFYDSICHCSPFLAAQQFFELVEQLRVSFLIMSA